MDSLLIILTPVIVGFIVSLDVAVFTLASGHGFIARYGAIVWSAVNAFWHALFLAIGLGVFHFLIVILKKFFMFLQPTLIPLLESAMDKLRGMANIIAEYAYKIIQAIYVDISIVPEVIGAAFAIIVCFYFYRRKLKIHAKEIEEKDVGFSDKFKRFGELNYAAVLVAMDMWVLTPTLRNLVVNAESSYFSIGSAVIFIALLFTTVFVVVVLVSFFLRKITSLKNVEKNIQIQYLMVVLEPMGVFYFAFYAINRAVFDNEQHSVIYFVLSLAVTIILLIGRNKKIVNAIREECSNK